MEFTSFNLDLTPSFEHQTMTSTPPNLSYLPPELHELIASHLRIPDHYHLFSTSRHFYSVLHPSLFNCYSKALIAALTDTSGSSSSWDVLTSRKLAVPTPAFCKSTSTTSPQHGPSY